MHLGANCAGTNTPCDAFCDAHCNVAIAKCGSSCDSSCDGLGSTRPRVVRGRPIPVLDAVASAIGVSNKLALFDSRADNHNVSKETEAAVVGYLEENGLDDVMVRINQYDPVGEWERMKANDRIAAPLRYTFGTYDWVKYTIMPGRLVGGDWYNPFSDTIHLYSDIPSLALTKAAYAKDVHSRQLPGIYAASQDLPMVGLMHETLANQEVMSYVRRHGTMDQQTEAARVLFPDFAGSMGSQVLGFLPYGSIYGRAAGAVTGHAFRIAREQIAKVTNRVTSGIR